RLAREPLSGGTGRRERVHPAAREAEDRQLSLDGPPGTALRSRYGGRACQFSARCPGLPRGLRLLAMTKASARPSFRHCEEGSDEAIQGDAVPYVRIDVTA